MRAIVETYKSSKVFEAPIGFVFAWCTDFREDDGKMTGSRRKRHFLEKSKTMAVWRLDPKEEGGRDGIRAVWLNPPSEWHLEACGDIAETGDYRLKALGKSRTLLEMTFQVSYDSTGDVEERAEWEGRLARNWDSYGRYLEKDYLHSISKRA